MKFLLVISAILFIAVTGIRSQDVNPRASAAWTVKSYDVSARVEGRVLNATAKLELQNVGTAPGSRLTLRISESADVSTAEVNGANATFTKGQEKLTASRNLQRIIVNVPGIQPGSDVTVRVSYSFKVDENGGLSSISSAGSQFLPLSFWYPTPNSHYSTRGADFAPFKLSVSGLSGLVSSGDQAGESFSQRLNGQPFFVSGDFDKVEANGVTVFLPKGAAENERKRAGDLALLYSEAAAFSSSSLGSKSTVPLRIVAVRRGAGFSDSGTVLMDYAAFRRQKVDSQTAVILAEAAAKIWLGNVKAVRGEGFGVIREGLSRFIANQFLEKKFGPDAARAERFRQIAAYSTVSRSDAPFLQAAPVDSSYYASVAYKGAMTWRLISNEMGQENFFKAISGIETLTLPNIVSSLAGRAPLLEYSLTNVTDTNLLVGLPQVSGVESKVAVRNTGTLPVNVQVLAVLETGERKIEVVNIAPKSFGEAVFKTNSRIVRTEIDPEKVVPQTDYSDDVAPREFVDSNPLVAIKRAFDKQDFTTAEQLARTALRNRPYLDELSTWLGRSLASQNKDTEAQVEFKRALDSVVPTPYTMAWSNVGLGDIAARRGVSVEAGVFYQEAVTSDSDYGATLAGRLGRQKVVPGTIDDSIRSFFAGFDKAVTSARKTEVDALIAPGEISRFAAGIVGGQPEIWETTIVATHKIDQSHSFAETTLRVKRLGTENIETGTAVFVLVRIGNVWKISGVEVFEVR